MSFYGSSSKSMKKSDRDFSGREEEKKEEEPTQQNSDESCSSWFISAVPVGHQSDPQKTTDKDDKVPSKPPNCCRRFAAEINPFQPWFTVDDRGTGREIDIPESFAPPTCRAFLWKSLATGFTIGTLAYGLVDSGSNVEFYFAYLSNWALLFSCFYLVFSLYNTVNASRMPQPKGKAGCLVRTTWVLYELAMHTELVVSILYWVLQYEPGDTRLTFLSIVPHSVIAAILFIDGNIINRIPVRWMHWYGFVLPVEILYCVWTLIHDLLTDVGEKNYEKTGSSAFGWQEDWERSLIISVVVLFGIGPAVYIIMWMVSAYAIPCVCMIDRHIYTDAYKDDMLQNQKPTVSDVEEGSIFKDILGNQKHTASDGEDDSIFARWETRKSEVQL